MFKNFKNCITTNLISIFGYLIFIASVIVLFGILPKYMAIEIDNKEVSSAAADMAYFSFMFVISNFIFIIFCIYILLFILFISYFFERHLQNSGEIKPLKFLENFNRPKTIAFWLGYFLIFFPIYHYLILFILFFIKFSIVSFSL
ncbi:hypothetical protein IJ818_01350 [bacterium]|nr:hypothetical protein [bacterium]